MKHMFDCGMMDSDKRHTIKKADIFFLMGIAAVSLIAFIIMRLNSITGSYAVISYDGLGPLVQITLDQSEPRYFLITYHDADIADIKEFSLEEWENFWEGAQVSAEEYNAFVYQDKEISMLYSSCPDKICVHHKAISMTGENIICLPHKLVIQITSDKKSGLDGVAY